MLEQKIITEKLTDEEKSIRVIGQGCLDNCRHEKKDWIGREPTQFTVCYKDIYQIYASVPGCVTYDAIASGYF